MTSPTAGPAGAHGRLGPMMLAALGIVYGDIGTSPLYTLKECVAKGHGVNPAYAENVLGVLSLIFWALTMVVTVKYIAFIMRADNRGEGGILALLALVPEKMRSPRAGRIGLVAILVLVGTGLLYGDGVITPAISVLSAVEGLEVATTKLTPAVLPITCGILVLLFAIQSRGTGGIGRAFGPVMILWFATLAVLGVNQIARNPQVLAAVDPVHAVRFFQAHEWHGFALLGSVVLAVTGGEALYADMGHFGPLPIRAAWFTVVWPALLVNYFGQGALLLSDPSAAANPFFSLVPGGVSRYLLVAIATAATIIASQALISGAFSLTQQAVQLGFFPRVTIRHTSHETEGQIYIPEINWALAISCVVLVLGFQRSTRIAAAYGIAVTGTMAITSVVFYVVLRRAWKWPIWKAAPLLLLFLAFDLPFLGANLVKFKDGGYVPIFMGAVVFVVMVVWKIGRTLLADYYQRMSPPWDAFLADVDQRIVSRIPGTGVFLASSAGGVPPIMIHHARRIRVLPETIIVLTLEFEHVPFVRPDERMQVEPLGRGFYRLVAHYGFQETPNVPALVASATELHQLPVDAQHTTYYLGRETFLATSAGRMGQYTERLFGFLNRNARSATAYFGIPPEQVVELGHQIDL